MKEQDHREGMTTRVVFGFREGLMFGFGLLVPAVLFLALVTATLVFMP
jgi:hypothetical protein